MRTELDRLMATYRLSFLLPIVLIGRAEWEYGILATAFFFCLYFLLPKIKLIRAEIAYLDAFVLLSYFIMMAGCWLLYSNGYDTTHSIWLYIFMAVFAYQFDKKIRFFINRNQQEC